MQIWTIQKGFEAFECKSNHSKRIRSMRMEIQNIWKWFEAFEYKFDKFERDSKHSNVNYNHSKGIWSVECKFEQFERYSKCSNSDSNHSKGFEAFECKLTQCECKLKPFERVRNIRMQILSIRMDSKHWNANSNHSKGIQIIRMQILTIQRSIQMQIRTIWKGFESFKCKFEPFERDFKHSNANLNNSKGIRSIRMQCKF